MNVKVLICNESKFGLCLLKDKDSQKSKKQVRVIKVAICVILERFLVRGWKYHSPGSTEGAETRGSEVKQKPHDN